MDPQQLSGSYESLFKQVDYLLNMGNVDDALPILARLHTRLAKLSDSVRVRRPELEEMRVVVSNVLGPLYRERKRYDDAIAIYQELLDTTANTDQTDWKHALALLTIDKGDALTGLDMLRSLTVANPGFLPVWLSLGSGLIGEGLFDEAEATLMHAIELKTNEDDDLSTAYDLLFVVYKKQKKYDAAEQIWRQWWQISGEETRGTLPLYEMYFQAEMYDKVTYWLEKEKDPLLAGFYRAQLMQRRGDVASAQKLWQKVASLKPERLEWGWDMWAEAVLRSDGDAELARARLTEAISQRKISMRGILLLAVAQLRLGRNENVHTTLQTYARALRKDGITEEQRIPFSHWQLFNQLAPADVVAEFEPYFNTQTVDAAL